MLLSSVRSAGEGIFLNTKGEDWIKWSQKGVKLWVLVVRACKRFVLGWSAGEGIFLNTKGEDWINLMVTKRGQVVGISGQSIQEVCFRCGSDANLQLS